MPFNGERHANGHFQAIDNHAGQNLTVAPMRSIIAVKPGGIDNQAVAIVSRLVVADDYCALSKS